LLQKFNLPAGELLVQDICPGATSKKGKMLNKQHKVHTHRDHLELLFLQEIEDTLNWQLAGYFKKTKKNQLDGVSKE
jgi:hypothetical protein